MDLPLLFGLLALLSVSHPAHCLDLPWDEESSPELMESIIEKRLSDLPQEGKVEALNKLWPGNYWPTREGSINVRWFARKNVNREAMAPDRERVRKMSIPELAELSPAEKYDLYLGRYDYPLSAYVTRIADPKALPWEGICHGWSPASINHPEPTPKLMRNPDGIEIPFGSTDIKALLSFYYAYFHKVFDTHQMGKRCFNKSRRRPSKECQEDLNAGAFHLILSNRIAKKKKSFILDIQPGIEVWNHPIRSFRSNIVRDRRPLKGQVEMSTEIEVIEENGHGWNPSLGSGRKFSRKIYYRYALDLDPQGMIIGGLWLSQARPDFIWTMNPPQRFEGILGKLKDLLDED